MLFVYHSSGAELLGQMRTVCSGLVSPGTVYVTIVATWIQVSFQGTAWPHDSFPVSVKKRIAEKATWRSTFSKIRVFDLTAPMLSSHVTFKINRNRSSQMVLKGKWSKTTLKHAGHMQQWLRRVKVNMRAQDSYLCRICVIVLKFIVWSGLLPSALWVPDLRQPWAVSSLGSSELPIYSCFAGWIWPVGHHARRCCNRKNRWKHVS